MPRSPTQMLRRSFSLAENVKRLYPGSKAREQLCFDLAPHYEDALFSTEEEPHEVEHNNRVLYMHPTRKSDTKIRVRIKP